MSAREAFDLGFADRVVDAVKIAARFDATKFRVKQLPANVAALLQEVTTMPETTAKTETPSDPTGVPGDETTPAEMTPPSEPEPPLEDARAAATTDALAYAREISDLCTLAGEPRRIGEFLAKASLIDEVRAALLKSRADRDAATVIDNARPTPTPRPRAAWDSVSDPNGALDALLQAIEQALAAEPQLAPGVTFVECDLADIETISADGAETFKAALFDVI